MKHIVFYLLLATTLTACDSPQASLAHEKQALTTHDAEQMSVVDKMVSVASEHSQTLKNSTQISDIWALQGALKRVGIEPDDGIKWQQRLAEAQNEAEVKAVLSEQITHLNRIVVELDKVKLHSPEVIMIKEQLKNGAKMALEVDNQLVNMNLSDPDINQKILPLNQKMLESGQLIFGANDDLLALAHSLGFDNNEEVVAYYELYRQQFEQFQHNQ